MLRIINQLIMTFMLFKHSPLSISLVVIVVPILFLLLEIPQQSSILVLGSSYTREDFPSDFIFGSSTSAYQVEGAAFEDGRTPSVFDTKSHQGGGDNGDVACDEYHKYKEDVQLMVDTRLDAYRFSISWSRVIPNGRGPVNQKGVEYYNNLINELINNGIQPHVTLLHWDLPQALQDAYGGFNDQQFVTDFTAYADVCFKEFGDRVLHWTTFNEPNLMAYFQSKTQYVVAHHFLLAHASTMNLYRQKYKATQNGYVGLNIFAPWFIPQGDTQQDLIATERATHFLIGWFIHPLIFGDYPDIMKCSLGSKLPSFTQHQAKLVNGSYDFIGMNMYTAYVVKKDPSIEEGIDADFGATFEPKDVKGKFVQGALEYFKRVYGNPPSYIHENGIRTFRNASLHDTIRVEFLNATIGSLLDATRNGSNVRGYFQWAFLDVFEPMGGFTYGFGLYNVDLDDPDLRRYPKLSAHWYSTFLKGEKSNHNNNNVVIKQMNNSTYIL